MKLNQLTLGSDPEFMLFNRAKDRIVSAIPVIPQNKEQPVSLGKGFAFYHDNVMLEATVPPAASRYEFVNNTRELFSRIYKKLGNKYDLRCTASHTFSEKEVDHDDARVAGCSPEFDAYAMDVCLPPQFVKGFRSAGGHIHIGRNDFAKHMDNPDGVALIDPYNKADVIKLMDIFVGLPLMVIDKDPSSPARKSLYGKAGRHRPTAYGVEYRTPGNYWLGSPSLTGLIYDLTAFVSDLNGRGKTEGVLSKYDGEEIAGIIDSNNVDEAARMVEKVEFPTGLYERINEARTSNLGDLAVEWNIGR